MTLSISLPWQLSRAGTIDRFSRSYKARSPSGEPGEVKSLLGPIQTDEHGEIRLGFCQQEILLKTFLSFQNRESGLSKIIGVTRLLTSPGSPLGDLAL